MIRNPKQVDSNLYDCRPQVGKCPVGCNQCFYNRVGTCTKCSGRGRIGITDRHSYSGICDMCGGTGEASVFYCNINEPNIPDPAEVGNGIVRMNCGHDSNLQRKLVIATAGQYKNFFFNTSIPNYDFPGPVVLTINCCEEEPKRAIRPPTIVPPNLMFVRIRTSASNLGDVHRLVTEWGLVDVPIVITFMAYYDDNVVNYVIRHRHPFFVGLQPSTDLYEYETRHINDYWCPTREMKIRTMKSLGIERNRLLTMCGTYDSNYCKDCHNCESYYWITRRRLDAIAAIADINEGE